MHRKSPIWSERNFFSFTFKIFLKNSIKVRKDIKYFATHNDTLVMSLNKIIIIYNGH